MLEYKHHIKAGKALRAFRNVLLLTLTGVVLTGCASGGLSSLTSGTPSLAPDAAVPVSLAQKQPPAVKTNTMARPAKTVTLAMSPIIGPPANVSKKLTSKIKSELKKRNIKVVKGKAGYNMHGYLVSSAEGKGAKLAYIWDINNKAGRRQHRISGEKLITGGKSKNPWSGIGDKAISALAGSAANEVAGWLVRKSGGSTNIASAKIPRNARKVRANRIPSGRGPMTTSSTGSKQRRRIVMAMVVPVTGAPGDGKSSLTKAIKTKLYGQGIRLTSKRTDTVYQVRGVVQIGKTKNGKQPIQIDWRVYDPKGKRLGTVTQKNEIPQGSLNGSWGPIAEAAAGAAANGITKLLPKSVRQL